MKITLLGVVLAVAALLLPACSSEPAPQPASTLLLNITSGATEDTHAVTMALQLAGHGLDDGRTVVLFFNVRGVDVPTVDLPDGLAFHADPLKAMLAKLIERGAEVHVCPHCLAAKEIDASQLIDGAQVTTRKKLFAHLSTHTVVFTY